MNDDDDANMSATLIFFFDFSPRFPLIFPSLGSKNPTVVYTNEHYFSKNNKLSFV